METTVDVPDMEVVVAAVMGGIRITQDAVVPVDVHEERVCVEAVGVGECGVAPGRKSGLRDPLPLSHRALEDIEVAARVPVGVGPDPSGTFEGVIID